MTKVNADDPVAHEKKGRALMLLDKNDDGLDELRKAVHLDPKNADVSTCRSATR